MRVKAVLKSRTLRIALLLEEHLGIPRRNARRPPPLDMLVATILSQNTNDTNSHRAYLALRKKYPGWNSVAHASPKGLRSAIRSAGMATQKSRHIREALAAVRARYGTYDLSPIRRKTDDQVLEELTALNGVGVKTAACVLLFSLGRNAFPVDTHVHRLCTRLGIAPGCTTPEKTFEAMRGIVPPGKAHSLHTNMIRFGRTVCRPSAPACGRCVLYAECRYEGKARSARQENRQSAADRSFMLLDNV